MGIYNIVDLDRPDIDNRRCSKSVMRLASAAISVFELPSVVLTTAPIWVLGILVATITVCVAWGSVIVAGGGVFVRAGGRSGSGGAAWHVPRRAGLSNDSVVAAVE